MTQEKQLLSHTAHDSKTDKNKREDENSIIVAPISSKATIVEDKPLPHIVELGKFFIDIAKLIFGGVILTILLDYRDYKMPLLVSGLVTLMFFVILGTMIIKKASK